ncbi:MAG TPA: hypothetical protein VJT16_13400, partial [Streptosporangiaceae bacterium]|nr:hypothetical protein [Streptosporangiaceae bacterium]
PSAILRLLRALTTDEVGDVLSILFRLRHAPAMAGTDSGEPASPDRQRDLLDPGGFPDVADLMRRNSQASRQAHAELLAVSEERVRALTDALLQAQPRACSAILADGSFLGGKVGHDTPSRRAARDMHAIHRGSLVVFGTAG